MIGTSVFTGLVIAFVGAVIAAIGYAVHVARESVDFDISNVGSEE